MKGIVFIHPFMCLLRAATTVATTNTPTATTHTETQMNVYRLNTEFNASNAELCSLKCIRIRGNRV
jgi:hypothetical protein